MYPEIEVEAHILSSIDADVNPAFKIENIHPKIAKDGEALERLEEGVYDWSPLPATDDNRGPIAPSACEEKLSDATILLQVILSLDVISSNYFNFMRTLNRCRYCRNRKQQK